MPTVNTYFRDESHLPQLEALAPSLKEFVAEQLTCGDRALRSDEVSVRLLHSLGKGMLADVELDITAAPYRERIERQDEICRNVSDFVMTNVKDLHNVQVWLNLNELGHSQE